MWAVEVRNSKLRASLTEAFDAQLSSTCLENMFFMWQWAGLSDINYKILGNVKIHPLDSRIGGISSYKLVRFYYMYSIVFSLC